MSEGEPIFRCNMLLGVATYSLLIQGKWLPISWVSKNGDQDIDWRIVTSKVMLHNNHDQYYPTPPESLPSPNPKISKYLPSFHTSPLSLHSNNSLAIPSLPSTYIFGSKGYLGVQLFSRQLEFMWASCFGRSWTQLKAAACSLRRVSAVSSGYWAMGKMYSKVGMCCP